MLNPEERFVVNSMSRAEIAEELNNALAGFGSPVRFTPDDPRLTAKVCGEYVDALYGIDIDFIAEHDSGSHEYGFRTHQASVINGVLGTSFEYQPDEFTDNQADEDDYDPTDPDGSGQDY